MGPFLCVDHRMKKNVSYWLDVHTVYQIHLYRYFCSLTGLDGHYTMF